MYTHVHANQRRKMNLAPGRRLSSEPPGSLFSLAWNTVHPVWMRPFLISNPGSLAVSEEKPDVLQPSRPPLSP